MKPTARVRQRVIMGGHHIPDNVVERRDPDLANAEAAMKRAAVKAWEIAKATHTAVVYLENDVIKEEYPE